MKREEKKENKENALEQALRVLKMVLESSVNTRQFTGDTRL
jgi:hypothetical protein